MITDHVFCLTDLTALRFELVTVDNLTRDAESWVYALADHHLTENLPCTSLPDIVTATGAFTDLVLGDVDGHVYVNIRDQYKRLMRVHHPSFRALHAKEIDDVEDLRVLIPGTVAYLRAERVLTILTNPTFDVVTVNQVYVRSKLVFPNLGDVRMHLLGWRGHLLSVHDIVGRQPVIFATPTMADFVLK